MDQVDEVRMQHEHRELIRAQSEQRRLMGEVELLMSENTVLYGRIQGMKAAAERGDLEGVLAG